MENDKFKDWSDYIVADDLMVWKIKSELEDDKHFFCEDDVIAENYKEVENEKDNNQ